MLRVAETLHYYTPDDAEALLREALAVVEAAEVPEHLQPVALDKVCDLLAACHRAIEQVNIGAPAMTIPRG